MNRMLIACHLGVSFLQTKTVWCPNAERRVASYRNHFSLDTLVFQANVRSATGLVYNV